MDHVVAGEVITSAMIVEKGCIEAETVGGLKLALKFDPVASSVTANNIPITDFNIDSDFGTMHGMEGVLLEGILGAFEPCPKPPILDPIVAKGSYNTLIDFLIDTNSVGTLEANAPMSKSRLVICFGLSMGYRYVLTAIQSFPSMCSNLWSKGLCLCCHFQHN